METENILTSSSLDFSTPKSICKCFNEFSQNFAHIWWNCVYKNRFICVGISPLSPPNWDFICVILELSFSLQYILKKGSYQNIQYIHAAWSNKYAIPPSSADFPPGCCFPSAIFLVGKYHVSMSTHPLVSSGVRSVGEIYRSKIIRSKVYEFKNWQAIKYPFLKRYLPMRIQHNVYQSVFLLWYQVF